MTGSNETNKKAPVTKPEENSIQPEAEGDEEEDDSDTPRSSCGIMCCCKYTGVAFLLFLAVMYLWPTPNYPIQQVCLYN